jgi:Multicopper oxidase
MRATTFSTLAFATLLLALGIIISSGLNSSIPSVHAVSRSITLRGSYASGWNGTNPGPAITLMQGDMVNLNLISTDGAPHTFIIDVAKAGIVASPDCTVDKCSSQFSSSTTFTFTADMPAGTFTYYCSIHLQHMYGSLTVQSSSGSGSGSGTGSGSGSGTGSGYNPGSVSGSTTPTTSPTYSSPMFGTVLVVAAIVLLALAIGTTLVLLSRRRPKP